MKIQQHNWAIFKLVADRPSINLNPIWQRGAASKDPRRILLIDSILRGMDIPKVYLRKLPANGAHKHDAVEGQQRIRAILEFRAEAFSLNYPDPLPAIGAHSIHGLKFSQGWPMGSIRRGYLWQTTQAPPPSSSPNRSSMSSMFSIGRSGLTGLLASSRCFLRS